jgi:hypothetical protein
MTEVQGSKRTAGELATRVLLLAIPAAAFTLLVVQYSLRRGKLLVPPTFDDISYLKDGLSRLDAFHKGGFQALLEQFPKQPAHSPLSALLAISGFALFGVHDWAPYAANGVIILTLLVFADYLTRGMSLGAKVAAMLFTLTAPIASQCIYEFRPDMGAGLLTTIALVLLLEDSFIASTPRRRLAVGLIVAVALWAKPSVFPVTLALTLITLTVVTLRDLYLQRGIEARPGFRAYARAWLQVLVPAIVLPVPYFLVNGRGIVNYLKANVFGSNQHIWKFHAGWDSHLLYFASGWGGQVMLGRHLEIMAGVLLVGGAVALLRRDKARVVMLVAFATVLAATYLGPTTNPIKTQFLATPFAFLLISGSLLTFRYVAALPVERRFASLRLLLPMALCLGLWWARTPAWWGAPSGPAAAARYQCVNDVHHGLTSHAPPGRSRVLIGVIGPLINGDLLSYLDMKDGEVHFEFFGDSTNPELSRYTALLKSADFVVLGDPDNPEDPQPFACNAILGQTLPLTRSHPDFRLVTTAPNGAGKNYYVFQRVK